MYINYKGLFVLNGKLLRICMINTVYNNKDGDEGRLEIHDATMESMFGNYNEELTGMRTKS